MTMNGHFAHPLFKFLKKNCDEFYNYSTSSAKKPIPQGTGIFLYKFNKKLNQPIVTYYSEQDIDRFLTLGK